MSRKTPRQSLSVPAVAFLCVVAGSVSAADRAREDRLPALMENVRPAFVFVGGGSGAVISPDGYLISNAHVVGGKKKFTVRLGNGESHEARVVGLNREGDLALLKIAAAENLEYLPLGDSDAVPVGTYCMAVGNPLALGLVDQQPTFTLGVISAKHLYRGTYNDALVTDAPVNPGNSGGPLVNREGELIGVNGQIETRWGLRANTGIALALPSNQIKRWLPRLKKAGGKNVPRGAVPGIQWEAVQAEDSLGAPVKNVAECSLAAAVGLKAGDIIVRAADQPVWNVVRFRSILAGYPAGSTITLEVRRDQAAKTFTVSLQKPPRAGFKLRADGKKGGRVIVRSVEKHSAAARAGLKKGDVVVAVGKVTLSGPVRHQAIKAVIAVRRRMAAGTAVELTVERQQGEETIKKKIQFIPGGR